ncbi:MAG: class I SAM-dependent methyltransferase [Pseudomonadota bacterium]
MNAISDRLTTGARRLAYGAGQAARVLWYTGHYAAGRRLMGPLTDPGDAPYAEQSAPLDRDRLRSSFRELFQTDWKNIAARRYKMPLELKGPPSPTRLWRESRDYFRDAAKVARRKASRGHSEVFTGETKGDFPRYFLQNFHYQTDGWLSDSSAARYEMQVETLFTGAAGAMRRAALPFIGDALKGRDIAETRLLDLACGGGGFLAEVKHNWPRLKATALDLSPAYLGRARAGLGSFNDIDFLQANAEETGLADASFDIVTCVYLFHELPPGVRRKVASEIARVLKPGGLLVHLDSLQYGDEPGLDILLENFPRGFHEPYYDSYCREDLAAIYAGAGLQPAGETVAFLSKASAFVKG